MDHRQGQGAEVVRKDRLRQVAALKVKEGRQLGGQKPQRKHGTDQEHEARCDQQEKNNY